MMLKHRKLYQVSRNAGRVRLEVCWRDDRFGTGVCFSIYDRGEEMLRFDLFENDAHWHSYREAGQPRHYFEPRVRRFGDRDIAALFQDAIQLAHQSYPLDDEAKSWLWTELVAVHRRTARA